MVFEDQPGFVHPDDKVYCMPANEEVIVDILRKVRPTNNSNDEYSGDYEAIYTSAAKQLAGKYASLGQMMQSLMKGIAEIKEGKGEFVIAAFLGYIPMFVAELTLRIEGPKVSEDYVNSLLDILIRGFQNLPRK